MMPPGDSKVLRYRKRAAELREIAANLKDETAQRELGMVATQYAKLADDIERVEQAHAGPELLRDGSK
jgi:hypothetical protein